MVGSYIQLGIAALLPVVVATGVFFIEKTNLWKKLRYIEQQIIIGIVFGGLAVIGTEWGIKLEAAQVNARDAAVLISGLMFGGPSGIIAGFIGGIERWFSVAWGVSAFSRVACTTSTILAGFLAAAAKKYLFEHKRPSWALALATGVVMEVFHMTLLFFTNMGTPVVTMDVMRACTIPMVIANSCSVMICAMLFSFLEKKHKDKNAQARISATIQRALFVAVVIAFVLTSYFLYQLQDTIAINETDSLLELAAKGVSDDIKDASDQNLMAKAKKVAANVNFSDLKTIANRYEVDEINLVNELGVIIDSTDQRFIGYNMSEGKQSSEFLNLLNTYENYVQEYGPISFDGVSMRKYAGVRTSTGFVQVGYNSESFQDDLKEAITGFTKYRTVGETGYILIFDEQLNTISSPDKFDISGLNREELREIDPETTFQWLVNDANCYCFYLMTEGYYIVSVLPEKEAMQMRDIAIYINTFLEVLMFGLLFYIVYMLLQVVILNRLKRVNESLTKIAAGDLEEVVDVRSSSEFSALSDDINSTVNTLKRYIAEASARIDQELEFAKSIQNSALPSTFPAFPKRHDFDIYATMNTAKEVGGDFYDFYLTDDDTLNFMIADVSGKGIPAAMCMMRVKAELKSLTEENLPLNDVFTRCNHILCQGNDAGMFATVWQGCLNLKEGLVQYVNAGHNPPLVCRKGEDFEYLKGRSGFVLAGMDNTKYRLQELQLEPGDTVFLYTDGVTEAQNAGGELYGEERLLEKLNSGEWNTMEELCHYIKSDVDAFVGDVSQFDDITMVAMQFVGKPPSPEIHFDEAKLDDIPVISEFVKEKLEAIRCPQDIISRFMITVDEIYSNIVKYSYPVESGPATVRLIIREEERVAYIRFEDEGNPYNPVTKEDPNIDLDISDRDIGGLGIFVVKNTMDDMKYKYEDGKNILTVTKYLP